MGGQLFFLRSLGPSLTRTFRWWASCSCPVSPFPPLSWTCPGFPLPAVPFEALLEVLPDLGLPRDLVASPLLFVTSLLWLVCCSDGGLPVGTLLKRILLVFSRPWPPGFCSSLFALCLPLPEALLGWRWLLPPSSWLILAPCPPSNRVSPCSRYGRVFLLPGLPSLSVPPLP